MIELKQIFCLRFLVATAFFYASAIMNTERISLLAQNNLIDLRRFDWPYSKVSKTGKPIFSNSSEAEGGGSIIRIFVCELACDAVFPPVKSLTHDVLIVHLLISTFQKQLEWKHNRRVMQRDCW